MLTLFNKLKIKKFASEITKNISQLKEFRVFTYTENKKTISKALTGDLEIKSPLETLLACAGSCEVHVIELLAKQHNVQIDKIEVELKGEYDFDVFLGKKDGPNTYTQIHVHTKIYTSEADKDKNKDILDTIVETGIDKCPVLSTLKLAGVKFNKKVSYH